MHWLGNIHGISCANHVGPGEEHVDTIPSSAVYHREDFGDNVSMALSKIDSEKMAFEGTASHDGRGDIIKD